MKKILILLMTAYIFCAGGSAMAAKADNIQLLTDLGIVDETITSVLNQPMRRSAFVKMFSSVENIENTFSENKPNFADVDFDADYGKALEWLYIMGAVSNGENFNPEESITYEQAAKIMVTVLGYGKEAEIEGGYPNGYVNIAKRLDLFTGIDGSGFNVSDACKMFENALEASSVWTGIKAYDDRGTEMPMLERYYHTTYKKGKMTKNTLTRLSKSLSQSVQTIAVDENEFSCDAGYDELIGREVIVYYRTEGENENEVVGIYETKKNNVVSFKIDNDTQFSDFTYKVYTDGKKKDYRITRAVDVIYNGRIYTSYSESDFLPVTGDVTLVDKDNDNKYETVIINSYKTYFASNGTGDGIIYDAMGQEFIDINDNCDCVVRENGEEVQPSAVTSGVLLEVRISKGDERKLIQIDICRNVVSGKITAIEDSYRGVTAGSVKYTLSEALRKLILEKSKYLDEIENGKVITLYLDSNGEVGYYTGEKSEKEFYTYLRKIILDDSNGEKTVLFRIILPDGTWKTVGTGKRIEYDGIKRKSTDFVDFAEQGGIKGGRPVRCRLNNEGNVIMLESLEKYELGYDRLTYKRSSRSFDGFCSIANDCAVFIVPGKGYEDDETMYELKNAGYFRDGTNYNMQVYEAGDELMAEVVVIPGNGKETAIPDEEPMMIVKNISLTSVDDEVCPEITAVTPNGEYIGVTRDAAAEFCDRITGKYLTFDKLNDGDVIRVLCDSSGKIINGERIVDIEKFKVNKYSGIYLTTGGFRDGSMHRGGYVYTIKDNIMTVPKIANPDFGSADIKKQLFVHSAQAAAAMVYDVEEETVRSGGTDDIIAYKDYEDLSITSFVYLITSLGDPKSMIIFK